jgi:chromosome segregation ATPase
MAKPDVVAQVAALKAESEKAVALRAQAEAQLGVAKRELAKIDADLTALGVEPEQAADHLRVLEEQLAVTTTELSALIEHELSAYREILAASRA